MLSTVSTNHSAAISCTIAGLFDSKVVSAFASTPAAGTFQDRDGASSSPGRVYIESNDVVGIFPFVSQSVLVNTAVLTGQHIQSSMYVLWVHRDGSLNTLPAGSLQCQSRFPSVVQVDSSCSYVYLNGSETSGSDLATITVNTTTQITLSAIVSLAVWYPSTPLLWSISNPVLNVVRNWLDASHGCSAI